MSETPFIPTGGGGGDYVRRPEFETLAHSVELLEGKLRGEVERMTNLQQIHFEEMKKMEWRADMLERRLSTVIWMVTAIVTGVALYLSPLAYIFAEFGWQQALTFALGALIPIVGIATLSAIAITSPRTTKRAVKAAVAAVRNLFRR